MEVENNKNQSVDFSVSKEILAQFRRFEEDLRDMDWKLGNLREAFADNIDSYKEMIQKRGACMETGDITQKAFNDECELLRERLREGLPSVAEDADTHTLAYIALRLTRCIDNDTLDGHRLFIFNTAYGL